MRLKEAIKREGVPAGVQARTIFLRDLVAEEVRDVFNKHRLNGVKTKKARERALKTMWVAIGKKESGWVDFSSFKKSISKKLEWGKIYSGSFFSKKEAPPILKDENKDDAMEALYQHWLDLGMEDPILGKNFEQKYLFG